MISIAVSVSRGYLLTTPAGLHATQVVRGECGGRICVSRISTGHEFEPVSWGELSAIAGMPLIARVHIPVPGDSELHFQSGADGFLGSHLHSVRKLRLVEVRGGRGYIPRITFAVKQAEPHGIAEADNALRETRCSNRATAAAMLAPDCKLMTD